MSRPAKPAKEPEAVSAIPDVAPRTTFLVLSNPMRETFELHFMAGPTGNHGNVRAEVILTPDQAQRLAATILSDLRGWAERVAKTQATDPIAAARLRKLRDSRG